MRLRQKKKPNKCWYGAGSFTIRLQYLYNNQSDLIYCKSCVCLRLIQNYIQIIWEPMFCCSPVAYVAHFYTLLFFHLIKLLLPWIFLLLFTFFPFPSFFVFFFLYIFLIRRIHVILYEYYWNDLCCVSVGLFCCITKYICKNNNSPWLWNSKQIIRFNAFSANFKDQMLGFWFDAEK